MANHSAVDFSLIRNQLDRKIMDAAMVKAIAELIGALAWPVVASVTLYGFRSEFRKIIANLRLLKWGDKEAKFEETWRVAAVGVSVAIDDAVKEQPALRYQQPVDSLVPSESDLSVAQEDGIRNSAVVLTEWKNIEIAIVELVKALGMKSSRQVGWNLDSIDKRGILPKSLLRGIRELYRLRNQVAHKPDFEPDERSTEVYISSAREVLAVLIQLTSQARTEKS